MSQVNIDKHLTHRSFSLYRKVVQLIQDFGIITTVTYTPTITYYYIWYEYANNTQLYHRYEEEKDAVLVTLPFFEQLQQRIVIIIISLS